MKDWCTKFPDKWFKHNLASCCKTHDWDYEHGIITRLQADNRLFACIKKKSHTYVASIMWVGVRLFGWRNY